MKAVLMTLIVLASTAAQAKVLTAECQNDQGESIAVLAQIENINTKPVLQTLEIDGYEQDMKRDVSQMPVYSQGAITLSLQFGRQFYSSANIQVKDCDDSFSATGTAEVKKYVGGFAGTSYSKLTCTCSFK